MLYRIISIVVLNWREMRLISEHKIILLVILYYQIIINCIYSNVEVIFDLFNILSFCKLDIYIWLHSKVNFDVHPFDLCKV